MKDGLAQRIAQLTPEQRRLYLMRRKQKEREKDGKAKIPLRRGDGPWPASVDQEALWFFHQLDPSSFAYNISSATLLTGRVDALLLERSLAFLVRRHEILRSRFANINGKPFQEIRSELEVRVPMLDLAAMEVTVPLAMAQREATKCVTIPFDLARAPLFRLPLIRLAADRYVLVAVIHHSIGDWWSCHVFQDELFAIYHDLAYGRQPKLPALSHQFVDYALWRNHWLKSPAYGKQVDYWRNKLKGAPTILDIPGDRPRPPQLSYRGARAFMVLPDETMAAVRAVSREFGATSYMAFLAGIFAFLSRYTGARDILIGTSTSNRELKETERMLGYLVNMLPLRGDLREDPSFNGFIEQVRDTVLQAFENQELPFHCLVKELNPERDMSRMPLYQTEFTFTRLGGIKLKSEGLVNRKPLFKQESIHVDRRTSAIDIQISFLEADDRTEMWFEYLTDIFEENTILRMGQLLMNLLANMLKAPLTPISKVNWMDEENLRVVLADLNRTEREFDADRPAHEGFERWAATEPERPAVRIGEELVSYGELNRRAGGLARLLAERGAGLECRIGICCQRNIHMVVALLACLKAGCSYVPMDPCLPAARLRYTAEDAGCRLMLVEAATAEIWREGHGPLELDGLNWDALNGNGFRRKIHQGTGAYMIYTSGSTGLPKGVVIQHRSLVNLLADLVREPGIGPDDRILALTTIAFDIAGMEWLMGLSNGALMVMGSREEAMDPHLLMSLLRRRRINLMQGTPATWRMLFAAGWPGDPKMRAICTGEALPPDLAPMLARNLAEAWNLYGPTETTVWVTRTRVSEKGPVHIGRPFANTRTYVTDRELRILPPGVPGELLLAGEGLARGYGGRPGLTAQCFVPDPFGGETARGTRLYRSGDLVRYGGSGEIHYLGRLDDQVKIRGYRIELGEIENRLRSHPMVAQALVTAHGSGGVHTRLAAYLVAPKALEADVAAITSYLKRELPDYMVPAALVMLDRFPLTPSGKIDRRVLPAPAWGDAGSQEGFVAAETETEIEIAGIWEQVLERDRVGLHDRFFDLGGHSLLATQVISRLRDNFGVEIRLKQLFDHPTVAGLATLIEAGCGGNGENGLLPLEPLAPGIQPPLSFAQERLWTAEQYEPGNLAYNLSFPHRVRGLLDPLCLEAAIDLLMRRHQPLRSLFPTVEGKPHLVIREPSAFLLPVIDVRGLMRTEPARLTQELMKQQLRTPFRLDKGPLLRIHLIQEDARVFALPMTMHHIITDLWSFTILIEELGRAYGERLLGTPSTLAPLAIQYADFAHWQRSWLGGERLSEMVSYWRDRLEDAPPLVLPTPFERAAASSNRGAHFDFVLPLALQTDLQRCCRDHEVTLFMLLLAAFKLLLFRYSDQDDVVVGSPIANRNRVETEPLIGFFVNMLVLRSKIPRDGLFTDLLVRVREYALGAYAHQDLPYEKLFDNLPVKRYKGFNPLFQVMFLLQNKTLKLMQLTGLRFEPVSLSTQSSLFDLSLQMGESEQGLMGNVEFNTALFDEGTIVKIKDHYRLLLERIVCSAEQPLSHLIRGIEVDWGRFPPATPQEITQLEPGSSREEEAQRERKKRLSAKLARLSDGKRKLLEKRMKKKPS